MTLRPKISERRPYKTVNVVFAIKDEVPAQDMVFRASRSAAMVGSVTLIPFWSTKVMSNDIASPVKTTSSWARGRMLV